MATVTKKELAYRISETTGLKKVVIKKIIQSFIDEIINELAEGQPPRVSRVRGLRNQDPRRAQGAQPAHRRPRRRAEQVGRPL